MPSNNGFRNPNAAPEYGQSNYSDSGYSDPGYPPPGQGYPAAGQMYNDYSRTQLSSHHINTPPPEDFNTDAMRGSMQQMLSDNLGQFVVCEFIIGTEGLARKEGVLYDVGRSYVTLYDEPYRRYIVCDVFSIKFVTFYEPGQRPPQSERSLNTSLMR